MARKSAHEKIMELRKEFDIPEEKTTPEEDAKYERQRERRRQRMDAAVTEENYVKMFNRDPWTDKWLGDGPDPDEIEEQRLAGKSKEQAVKAAAKHERAEWNKKFHRNVPTFHLPAEPKESKKVKKLRKERKQREFEEEYQQKVDIAYWWLECILTRSYADELYYQYRNDLDGLIELCYNWAIDWAEDMTWDDEHEISQDDMFDRLMNREKENSEVVSEFGGMKFRRREVAEAHRREYNTNPFENPYPDIPDEYWDEFKHWCKEHPLKKYRKKAKKFSYQGFTAAGLRRIAFLKQVNKKNKAWRKNLMLHDPMTGASFISEKKMRNHIRSQLKKYDEQRKKLVNMLDHMVADGQISEDYANHMMGDTKLVRDRIRKRWEEEYERMKVRHKDEEKRRKKQQKTYEARKKWYEKHGGTLGEMPVIINAEGEKITIKKIPPKGKGGKTLYCVDDTSTGTTVYSERSLEAALNISERPQDVAPLRKPTYSKEYWRTYNEIPDY